MWLSFTNSSNTLGSLRQPEVFTLMLVFQLLLTKFRDFAFQGDISINSFSLYGLTKWMKMNPRSRQHLFMYRVCKTAAVHLMGFFHQQSWFYPGFSFYVTCCIFSGCCVITFDWYCMCSCFSLQEYNPRSYISRTKAKSLVFWQKTLIKATSQFVTDAFPLIKTACVHLSLFYKLTSCLFSWSDSLSHWCLLLNRPNWWLGSLLLSVHVRVTGDLQERGVQSTDCSASRWGLYYKGSPALLRWIHPTLVEKTAPSH